MKKIDFNQAIILESNRKFNSNSSSSKKSSNKKISKPVARNKDTGTKIYANNSKDWEIFNQKFVKSEPKVTKFDNNETDAS